MTPQEARRSIGATVVYQPHKNSRPEFGVITGVSENGWVFVRYGTDSHSKATSAAHLTVELHRDTCPATYGEYCDGYCGGAS